MEEWYSDAMITQRNRYISQIIKEFKLFQIVALIGPRQCGKTTLARHFATLQGEQKVYFFDLEDYTDLAKLQTPKLTLDPLDGLIIIDEIQLRPDLFSYLRVAVDNNPSRKILILGSASQALLSQSAESLAGRISYIHVCPFSYEEVPSQNRLWLRGGFPRSFLASTDEDSFRWRRAFIQTYFERDLHALGIILPPQKMMRLWAMLTQFHGTVLNYSSLAEFLDVSVPSVKNYLAILEGTFMIKTLLPWFGNSKKRLVKSPKLYIRDSGIFHSFLEIQRYDELICHAKRGASWEGFAIEEVTKALGLRDHQCSFWSTHQGAEVDLVVTYNGKKLGFECKCTDQPAITKSILSAQEALGLDHLYILTPIEETFPLKETITVLALKDLTTTVLGSRSSG